MNPGFMIRLLCSLLFALIIGLMSGYQMLGVSRDFENYFEFFDIVRESVDYWNVNYRFEPGFTVFIYALARAGLDNFLIYSVVAGLIVFIKYFAIDFSDKYWHALLIFTFYLISRYIVLFEMTVLRAACAFSLAFYVFFRKSNNSIKLMDLVILGIAVLFHYSAIAFFLIYFSNPVSRKKIVFFSLAIFLTVYFSKNIVLTYLPDYMIVFSTYEDLGKATFLPIPFIIDIIFLTFIFFKFKVIDPAMRYAAMGMAISIALHFSLIDYSIFAARFRELLSVFILIYVVRAVYSIDKGVREVSALYVFLTGLMYLYGYFVYDPLLL